MRLPPTPQQAERIAHIVSGVTITRVPERFDWGGDNEGEELGKEARSLCHALSGYKPSHRDCFDCRIRVLNILRESIGLEPYDKGASEPIRELRLAICRECPAHRESVHLGKFIESCGRYILDTINPVEVRMKDGTFVKPCGCLLNTSMGKASFKKSKCPAGKW
jgi:hypothetical protein